MPPTFLLVAGVLALGFIGPFAFAATVVAALVPRTRAGALPVLRWGLAGAAAALALNAFLGLAYPEDGGMTIAGTLLGMGAGYVVLACARFFFRFAAPEPAR